MGGKAAVLLVLGFSLIFLVVTQYYGGLSNRAVDNSTAYYVEANAHQLAVSGANVALNQIFLDGSWSAGYSNVAMNGGEYDVTVNNISSTLKEIISTGTFHGETKTVKIMMQPSSFAKFAWYIGNMSSKTFITGDTVWGPFHSQSALNIEGDPVFFGKVTSLKGLNPDEKQLAKLGYDPKFYGGYESGVDVPLPNNYEFTDQKDACIDGVANHGGSSYFENTDVWLEFNGDGTLTYRKGSGRDTSTYGPPTTIDQSVFAPNGVIYVNKGDLYVKGQVKGQISIVAGESSGSGSGNVYVYDDITYTSDPMTWDEETNNYVPNNSCSDMLGIMATNNVRIMDNDNNNKNKNVRIDASIFCSKGGFELENKNMPPSGSLYLRGGIIAAKEELISEVDNLGMIKNGYKKYVVFDQRMLLAIPPHFPSTDKFEIVSWYE